ncbi:hypothetical protein MSIMFB_03343 [Mycobacterium simulans]|uniref:Carboxymuconolactone decarboxylase-like domain-containing protein n=1 Tax=Mycobacterium simulans TaxID=627089 RepID=A0A7Z7NBE9_9MYCO|nr:carboxymuconolactone decarboxylase family protein [Mycobacterium simulans]SOJ55863.1 hypothetical protein MSIMFB_03343 [Mycobacterium simulans]
MRFINYIEPVLPRRASGVVAEVYAEARREFGRLPEPLVMLSPDEQLLTAGWATLRETLLVGQVPRGRKEAVAAAVAASLRCPWCVDAHTTMLYAAGESDTAAAILDDKQPPADDPNAPYVAWAAGSGSPSGPAAPFGPDVAAEYLGTALEFHFIARLVLVLLDETFLPGGPRAQHLIRRAGGLAFARKVRASHRRGMSTQRLAYRPLPDDFDWAVRCPPVATAFASLSHRLDSAPHLPEASREVVMHVVASWRGESMPLSSGWTSEHTVDLPADLHAATRLALLTSLAPHQVTDGDVAAARPLLVTDAALVGALAWAALTAARRISTWIGRDVDGQTHPVPQAP